MLRRACNRIAWPVKESTGRGTLTSASRDGSLPSLIPRRTARQVPSTLRRRANRCSEVDSALRAHLDKVRSQQLSERPFFGTGAEQGRSECSETSPRDRALPVASTAAADPLNVGIAPNLREYGRFSDRSTTCERRESLDRLFRRSVSGQPFASGGDECRILFPIVKPFAANTGRNSPALASRTTWGAFQAFCKLFDDPLKLVFGHCSLVVDLPIELARDQDS